MGVDHTIIADGASGHYMRRYGVDLCVVGADRIAANGDVANKIATYSVAVLAKQHDIPFYVAAPFSTVDLKTPDGSHIPIEQRDSREVTDSFGRPTAPAGVNVYNPAFDVTPAGLIAAIVTEHGVILPVNESMIRANLAASQF